MMERETSSFSQSKMSNKMKRSFKYTVCLFICFGIAVIIINKCECQGLDHEPQLDQSGNEFKPLTHVC